MIEIKPSGFAGLPPPSIFAAVAAEEEEENECSSSPSTTSSSIGNDSDVSGRQSSEGEENEVQSAFNGGLDSMDALEEVLPIRRGISKFYSGKSKSFTSLAEASSSTIKDIAKPDNAYTRKRRNLLAFNVWEKNRSFPHRSNGGGISKRPISASRSALALAVAMSSSESISSTSSDSNSSSNSKSPPRLPPLYPRSRVSQANLSSTSPSARGEFSPWRSLSLADLQQCSNASTSSLNCSSMSEKD